MMPASVSALDHPAPIHDNFCILGMTWDLQLKAARSRAFEASFPARPQSFAALLPKTYQKIMQRFAALPAFEALYPHGIPFGTPYDSLINTYRDARTELSQFFEQLIPEAEAECRKISRERRAPCAGFENLLKESAIKWDPSRPFLFELPSWRARIGIEIENNAFNSIRRETFLKGFKRPWTTFIREAARLRARWGEIRVALLLDNVHATDIGMEEIADLSLISREELRQMIPTRENHLSIDVVWSGERSHFGEVKDFFLPLKVGGPGWKDVVERLDQMKALRKRSRRRPELDLFLINGISPPALEQLRHYPVSIYGPGTN